MESDIDTRAGKKRRSTWPKLLDLVLRVCHVVTSSVLYGGIIWAVPFARLSNWHHLTIASGITLIISGICGSRHWPYQGRGLMAWLHIGLLVLIHNHGRPAMMLPVLTVVLIAGVIGSHLPGFIRHWSLVHWQRVD